MYLSLFFLKFFIYLHMLLFYESIVHIELILLGTNSLALLTNSDDAICPFCFCFTAPLFFPTYQDKDRRKPRCYIFELSNTNPQKWLSYCGDHIFLDPLKFHVVQLSIGVHLNWRLV